MPISIHDKTYTYRGVQLPNNDSLYTNQDAGVPAGFSPLTFQVHPGNGTTTKTRVSVRLKVPVLADESNSCECEGTKIDEDIVDIAFNLGFKNDTARRAAILDYVQDLVLTTQFAEAVTNLVLPSA